MTSKEHWPIGQKIYTYWNVLYDNQTEAWKEEHTVHKRRYLNEKVLNLISYKICKLKDKRMSYKPTRMTKIKILSNTSTGALSWRAQCATGTPASFGGPLPLRCPVLPCVQQLPVGLGPVYFTSLPLLLVSMWSLLYLFSYRSSVQLVFGWFLGLNAL